MYSQTFSKFTKYYGKKHKNKLSLFNLLAIFAGGFEVLGLMLLYILILGLINSQLILNSPYYIALHKYLFSNYYFNLIFLILLIGSSFCLKELTMILYTFLQNKFMTDWKSYINNSLMTYYLFTPYNVSTKQSEQDKIYNLTTQSSHVLDNFIRQKICITSNFIISIMILIPISAKYPFETFIFISVLVTLIKVQITSTKSKLFQLEKFIEKDKIDNSKQIVENIKNLKEINLFKAEKHFYIIFVLLQKIFNEKTAKYTLEKFAQTYKITLINIVAILLFCVVLVAKIQNEQQILIGLGLFFATILRLIPISKQYFENSDSITKTEDLAQKMVKEYETYDFSDLRKPKNPRTDIQFQDKINFNKMNFGYEKNNLVLKNISFEIRKGEMIGIIGATNSGKTTLINILQGLFPITSGSMMIDFLDITSRNYYCVGDLVGYVPNDVNLIKGTVEENVAFGKDLTEINELEVIKALEDAKIYNDFAKTKQGLRSELIDMSRNQRQKLAFARAFYKKPEILILEDFTKGINTKTETDIFEILEREKRKKTIIAVTTNIRTLKMCDRIIYLNHGEIVANGSFEHLKTYSEEFKTLLKMSK